MGKKWIPLEANPEVLNEYAHKIGVSGTSYEFTDVYGLDEVRAGRGVGKLGSRRVIRGAAGASHCPDRFHDSL